MNELHLYSACPLCGSAELQQLAVADCSGHPLYRAELSSKMTWMICMHCTHIFREGYYTDEAAELIFGSSHDYQQMGDNYEGKRPLAARMIEKVLPFKNQGTWLDVGFGDGALLLTAHEYGFEPVGIDVRGDNVESLRVNGIEAHCSDLVSFESEPRFDVISMADVLEHMPFPLKALGRASQLLRDGGVLFLAMPNSESMAWRMLNSARDNPYWSELEHYHNFSKSGLYRALQAAGFSPAAYGISQRYRAGMEVVATTQGSRTRPVSLRVGYGT